MRIRFISAWMMLCAIAGSCAPEEKCSGKLFYDPIGVCRPCPMDATFKDGTCKCKAGYKFTGSTPPGGQYLSYKCVLKDGAMVETPDAGSPADTGAPAPAALSCSDYCSFANSCIGKNTLATAALPDIVTGLHADDTAECTDNCETELGNDGSSNPVVMCIDAGRAAADCEGKSTQQSLTAALMLVGNCCRPHKANALCKSICAPLKANALTAGMVDFCD